MRNYRPINDKEKKIILSAKTLTEAANKSGRSKSACYQLRVKHGVHEYKYHIYTKKDVLAIRKLLDDGFTVLEISKKLGLEYYSVQSKIYRIRARFG